MKQFCPEDPKSYDPDFGHWVYIYDKPRNKPKNPKPSAKNPGDT